MSRADDPAVDPHAWRLIVDPHADGAWNMAVDEAILEGYEHAPPDRPPTLRLYGWCPAALSLGRGQRAPESSPGGFHLPEGLDLVRRPTGGDAVLHEFERTYAVVAKHGTAPFFGGAVATYRELARALTLGLARLGVEAIPVEPARGLPRERGAACFERVGAWEIVARGRKLVGSAQARRRGAFLQHGSIPIRLDAARLGAALGGPVDGSRFTDLERAAAGALDEGTIDRALVGGFEEAFGVPLRLGGLSAGEGLRAAELRCWKYDSMAWTMSARIGTRETRWGPVTPR